MKILILKGSENYTCQVITLPPKVKVEGLDNLVKVTHQGNDVLTKKDADETQNYLFFPAGTKISEEYLHLNNEFRDPQQNADKTKKAYFESNCRVKAVKFKGVTSTGYIAPVSTLVGVLSVAEVENLKVGDEFNVIDGVTLCEKYIIKTRTPGASFGKSSKILDNIIDEKLAPEHFSTEHLLKNCDKLHLDDVIQITIKLHGTSARYFNTLTYKPLKWYEKLLLKLGVNIETHHYSEVVGSRKVIKSVGYKELDGKEHFYKDSGDIWTKVGEEYFKGKLNKGEAVYCEIVGKTYTGEAIQKGYSYGFDKPIVFIYRISNINPQGVEIDLSSQQVRERAEELGLMTCPQSYYGTLREFINRFTPTSATMFDLEGALSHIFYEKLLEKPSVFDSSVVEEGFCIRKDAYPKPHIYKIKAKSFLLHESNLADKQITNIEDDEGITVDNL